MQYVVSIAFDLLTNIYLFSKCFFFSTYLFIFASVSLVIVARPTTPPIVHVLPESDSHEVAQTQVSREFRDSLSVKSAVLIYAKVYLVI